MTKLLSALQTVVRRAPATLVALTIALTAVFAVLSTQAVQEQGFENFAPDNAVTDALERVADEFGSGVDPVQLVVESDEGPVLDAAGVRAAVELRERLLTDPSVAAAVIDAPGVSPVATYGDLVLQAAAAQGLDPAALDDAAVAQVQAATVEQLPEGQRTQATQLLGGDGDGTQAEVGAIILLLDGEVDEDVREEAVFALPDLTADVPGVTVSIVDFRLLVDDVNAEIEADLGRLLGIAFALIILILVAIYRRPVDVIASLLGLVFTIIWMQGISTLLGPGFLGLTGGMSEMSMAIPILLVGLGVDYGIHLTMRYREERSNGSPPSGAATGAIGAVGAALALATLTTVVGFLTNVTNPLPPLQDFGVFAAVGVISAFLIMTTFVPATRLSVDRWLDRRGKLRVEQRHGDERPSLLGRIAASLAPAATHRPWAVITAAALLTVLGGISATGLSTEFSQTEFFPDDSEALATIRLVEDAFGGALTERTQVLVTGDVEQPGVLAAVDRFEQDVVEVAGVRPVNGRADTDSIITRVESILAAVAGSGEVAADSAGASPTEGEAAPADAAPDEAAPGEATPGEEGAGAPDPQAVEALVAAAAEAGVGTPDGPRADAELGPLVEALLAVDPSATAVLSPPDALLVSISTQAGEDTDELRAGIDDAARPLTDLGLEVVAASDQILVNVVMDELRNSQITGLAVTLIASMVILSLAFWFRVREPLLGVLAILSVGLVVAWVLGAMAAVGLPFNVMTAMVSALAIGIGVPFGIHVVNRFLEDRERFADIGDAMRSTLRNTGGALVGSAVTTIAGFGSLMLSQVPPFRQFGAVVAMTIGLALVASVAVLPAMLTVYERRRIGRRGADADAPAARATPPAGETVASR